MYGNLGAIRNTVIGIDCDNIDLLTKIKLPIRYSTDFVLILLSTFLDHR